MVRKISKLDLQLMPWKNGGGLSAQVAIEPRSAQFPEDDFLWRLSTAFVKSAGPFSRFEKYQRVLVVVSGEGLELNGKILPQLSPLHFSGADEIFARPLSAEIQDLGVIFNSSQVSVTADVLEKSFVLSTNSNQKNWNYIYCVQGQVECGGSNILPGEFLDLGAGAANGQFDVQCQVHFGQNTKAVLLKINSII